jgi:hypothetical protein
LGVGECLFHSGRKISPKYLPTLNHKKRFGVTDNTNIIAQDKLPQTYCAGADVMRSIVHRKPWYSWREKYMKDTSKWIHNPKKNTIAGFWI